jgi:hypothetical protein
MKILFAILALSFFTISCGTQDTQTAQRPEKNNHILVFFDKTQSVDTGNAFIRNKYQSSLKNLIDSYIQKEGDRLDIYYIHENTSKARVLSVTSRTLKENTEGLNVTDLEAAKTTYDMSIGRERKMILEAALQKMLEKNSGESNAETNISISVPLLSTALDGGKNVVAFYFSDMVESIKTGRDFHKMAPISHDQAEEWAKADAGKQTGANLAGSTIKIVLPFEPTSSSKVNNPNVSDYWKIFFETLGVNSIEEI